MGRPKKIDEGIETMPGGEPLFVAPDAAGVMDADLSIDEMQKIRDAIANEKMIGGMARLYSKDSSGKSEYIGEYPIQEFSLESIKERFGGGDYRVHFHTSAGQFFWKHCFSISKLFRGKIATDAEKAAGSGGNGDIMRMLASKADTGGSEAMFMRMMQMQQAQSQQFMQMFMQSQATMVQALAGVFGGRASASPSAAGLNFSEAVTPVLLEVIRNAGKPSGTHQSIAETIETIKALKELAGTGVEKEEGEDGIMKFVKLLMPAVSALLSKGAPQPQAIDIPGAGAMPGQAPPGNPIAERVRQYANVLIMAGRSNGDPAIYADMIADLFDDTSFARLKVDLQNPEWRTMLAGIDPRAQEIMPWLEKLREHLLAPAEPEPTEKDA